MSKRATLKDVAAKARVSPATVSYVLNGKRTISRQTKERVRQAIEELGYVPDLSARSLSSRDSKLIGVVVPQTEPGSKLMLQNNFYSEIVGSIEYHARQHGYHVIISATDVSESYLTLAKERNLDGIIVIGMYPDEFYQQMKKTQIPIVLIDSYCNDHYYHSVRIDDAYGSYLATRHVLEYGHKRIAFFCGLIKENGVIKKRLTGYRQALEERGIAYDPALVFEGKIDYESGVQLARQLARSATEATAVVATADILAVGAMKGFYDEGLHVPDDISIIGFDDLELAQYMTPGLSTIKQEIPLKGERAVELLLDSINDETLTKHELVLPVSLITRGSVKRLG
ncbi:LacI family DNA-binding transcriptional regulator [Allofournierella sp.]|uniref:LacI family DNA-binding transcriptional regulator n=1 Tax=Allofournierella sp. TaxID=1940256 RepID=UPI003AB8CC88